MAARIPHLLVQGHFQRYQVHAGIRYLKCLLNLGKALSIFVRMTSMVASSKICLLKAWWALCYARRMLDWFGRLTKTTLYPTSLLQCYWVRELEVAHRWFNSFLTTLVIANEVSPRLKVPQNLFTRRSFSFMQSFDSSIISYACSSLCQPSFTCPSTQIRL